MTLSQNPYYQTVLSKFRNLPMYLRADCINMLREELPKRYKPVYHIADDERLTEGKQLTEELINSLLQDTMGYNND